MAKKQGFKYHLTISIPFHGFISVYKCIYSTILFSAIKKPDISNVVDGFVSTFSVIALYGFCYNKKVLFVDFWKISFFVCVIAEILNVTFQMYQNRNLTVLIVTILAMGILVAPIYYAFYQYAFRKNELWT